MRVIKFIKTLQTFVHNAKSHRQRIGFVPTMGALHEGHASLMQRCRRENTIAIVSIFINPKQFGPREDYLKYPRAFKKDRSLAEQCGMDIIFHPSVEEMYPNNYLTSIKVDGITKLLCGRSRPEHFNGVSTAVGKLLNIVMPDVMYLGQKDAQQIVVLKKMVEDLNFAVAVKACPTIRENDGLAMSSRNQYLTPKERLEAPVIYRSLQNARRLILAGEKNPAHIVTIIRNEIKNKSTGRIDYIECVDADVLSPLKKIQGNVLIALAVWFGKARLIDNIVCSVK